MANTIEANFLSVRNFVLGRIPAGGRDRWEPADFIYAGITREVYTAQALAEEWNERVDESE